MLDTQSNAIVFTLGEAALAVGVAKSTVHLAIKSGKLSAAKIDGKYEIQAAELFRVWPKGNRKKEPETAGAALVQQAVLEVKLEAREREIERLNTDKNKLESLLDDAHNERDIRRDELEKEQAKNAQLMLGYERDKEAFLAAKIEPKRSTFTPWILALIVIALACLLADRFGLISLLDIVMR